MSRRVTAVADPGAGDRMTDLVEALRASGVAVDVVPGDRSARRAGPFRDRRRADRSVAVLLGGSVPIPQWVRPGGGLPRIVRVAADPWAVPGDEAPPVPWVVYSERQRAALPSALSASTVVVPPLPVAAPTAGLASFSPDGAVVLVSAGDLWERPDHAIEAAAQLAARLPDVPIRWVVRSGDRWLASHDLAHAGLSERVQLVDRSATSLRDARVVVRPGVSGAVADLVTAADADVPVSAMAGEDVPLQVPWIDPFDVESVVADVVDLVATEDAARPRVTAMCAPLPRHQAAIEGLRVLLDV